MTAAGFGMARVAPEKAVFRPALPLPSPPGIAEMQMTNSYFEKLKDPRWQKKRLEALDAGQWKCARCSDANSTLHVHHRQYFKNRAPWEYEVGQLEVLCESCHRDEHEDPTADPLLVAASFVRSLGHCNRDAAASLVAGFCGHSINADHVGDPGAHMAGAIAMLVEKHASLESLHTLLVALEKRDRWTVQEAIYAFILDLNTRPAAAPPAGKSLL